MRRFRDIIEDIKAPDINNLWLDNGVLKYWGNNGWVTLSGSDPTINWNDIEDKPEFATVATSGSYNDLSNKPTIPSAYSLPIATASVLGGVKSSTTGTTAGKDYNVQINADGTMKVNVPWDNTTYSVATQSANGLMSSSDKTKLDNIATNANNYTLPDATVSVRGGVLMAGAVADTTVDGTETATTVATTLNALLASLRTAGILNQ